MAVTSTWRGGAVKATVRRAAARGVGDAADHLLQASQSVVPIESGELGGSGRSSSDESRLTAAVSYDTPYAVKQHEVMDEAHDAGRRSKYLEGPADEQGRTMAAIIAAAIRRAT